ncbi:MAG: CBS domain-containing protein, partial [Euryarchaeota archaeon]|nr:CBS domain-containing protein [Euryarchaeota archaeon]
RDVMVTDLITIAPDEKIALADLKMTRSSIGSLPVVEGDRIVGIITQRDIMLARGYEIGGLKARDLMSKELVTVTPETPLKEAIEMMLKNRIERLPVVDGGRFLGLVVQGNILKTLVEG